MRADVKSNRQYIMAHALVGNSDEAHGDERFGEMSKLARLGDGGMLNEKGVCHVLIEMMNKCEDTVMMEQLVELARAVVRIKEVDVVEFSRSEFFSLALSWSSEMVSRHLVLSLIGVILKGGNVIGTREFVCGSFLNDILQNFDLFPRETSNILVSVIPVVANEMDIMKFVRERCFMLENQGAWFFRVLREIVQNSWDIDVDGLRLLRIMVKADEASALQIVMILKICFAEHADESVTDFSWSYFVNAPAIIYEGVLVEFCQLVGCVIAYSGDYCETLFMENVDGLLWQAYADGSFATKTAVLRAMHKIFGVKSQEMIDRGFMELATEMIHPGLDPDLLIEILNTVLLYIFKMRACECGRYPIDCAVEAINALEIGETTPEVFDLAQVVVYHYQLLAESGCSEGK